MADLQRKTENLFDGTLLGGYYTNENFALSGDEDVYKSIKVYLTAGTYTFSWGKNVNVARYIIDGAYTRGGLVDTSTFTITSTTDDYVGVSFRDATSSSTVWDVTTPIMLNLGSEPLPYEPYGWVHSLRKQCSATETIQSGDTIYANGQPISTYSIKGNTVQDGTPTPSNPVSVNGVGNKTANLFDKSAATDNSRVLYTTGEIGELAGIDVSDYIPIESGEKYTLNIVDSTLTSKTGQLFAMYDETKIFVDTGAHATVAGKTVYTFTVPSGCSYIRFNSLMSAKDNVMFVKGEYTAQTFPSYEPYGYKIPISLGGVTTNLYTAEPLMKISDSVDSISNTEEIRAIKKYVITGDEIGWSQDGSSGSNNRYRLYISDVKNTGTYNTDFYNSHYKVETGYAANTSVIWRGTSSTYVYISVPSSDYPTVSDYKTYLQQQYTNGTPVTIWYQMANPTTTQITAPSIPTTDGTNSITVDTTVQPSEFTATWTGWHDSTVKEWDGSDWQ